MLLPDWPDLVIAALIAIATLLAARRGFIMELSGPVALFLSLIVPWYYGGSFDDALARAIHIGAGSAHVLGMVLAGILTFAIVMTAALLLNRFAKLPVFNIANAALGAFVGLIKGVFFVWGVLFIALYFPLTPDIRHDLHQSLLAAWITAPNGAIDGALTRMEPPFMGQLIDPIFERHHV